MLRVPLAVGHLCAAGCGRSKRSRTSAPSPPAPGAHGSLAAQLCRTSRSASPSSPQTAPCVLTRRSHAVIACSYLAVRTGTSSSSCRCPATTSRTALQKCKLTGHALMRADLATLTCLSPSGSERGGLYVGDTAGRVSLLRSMPGLPTRQLAAADFESVHKAHRDWVTQVRCPAVPRDLGRRALHAPPSCLRMRRRVLRCLSMKPDMPLKAAQRGR